jgi:hypothetical protein
MARTGAASDRTGRDAAGSPHHRQADEWDMSTAKPYTNGNGTETLRERINAVVKDVERLSRNDNELFAKYEKVGSTSWIIVISVVGVATGILGGLWGLAQPPIYQELKRLALWQLAAEQTYTRKDVFEARREAVNARIDYLVDRGQHAVVRQEYLERMRAIEQQLEHINGRAEEVRRDLQSIFPTTKVMDELLKRIDRLERDRLNAAPIATPAPSLKSE